jgi:hypothetical protein
MDQSTQHLLSGLLTDAGIGAGVGAAGMGAAEALSPEQEGHKKSILKSMLLGGAMGGLTGAGTRAFADTVSPDLQHDPRTMLASMFENKQAPAPEEHSIIGNLGNAAAGHPAIAGLTGGVLGGGLSAYRKSGINKEMVAGGQVPKSLQDYINTPRGLRLGRFPTMHPASHGALAGVGTYAVSKLLNQNEVNKDLYSKVNNPNALSEHLSQPQ